MKIIRAGLTDVEAIVDIAKQCFGNESWSKEQFFSELSQDNSIFLICTENEKTIGFLCGRTSYDFAEILDIAVLPEYRRRKVASNLLTVFCAFVQPLKEIYLEVKQSNKIALDFYNNMGFVSFSVRKKYYKDGQDAVNMKLSLRPVSKSKKVLAYLNAINSNPRCELEFENNFQLLIAVILSAQCTDKRVNLVTKQLFKEAPTAQDMINLGETKLKIIIHSCGFYNNKAKNIIKASKMIAENYNGEVPSDFQQLTALAGVGRKTANVVSAIAFKRPALAVDTHVFRVSHRLGLSKDVTPEKTEITLCKLFPKSQWSNLHYNMVLFGRYICKAQNPDCKNCGLKRNCFFYKKNSEK